MKISELIQLLSAHPQDSEVVVDGYESGYDVPHVYPKTIVDAGECSYAGSMEAAEDIHGGTNPRVAVVISRYSKGHWFVDAKEPTCPMS